ncbi:MAG: DUF3990 domain-containing protein [Spirochaetales bacterium]
MLIYHGSLVEVEKPKILPLNSQRTVDFGNGFYTTTDYNQACRWVSIKKQDEKTTGFVSIYDFNEELLKNDTYNVLYFPEATKEWLNFVIENRKNPSYTHSYDIIMGPVANDRVYTTIALYESHFLDVETTIKNLKTHKLVNQILFHTEKVLKELTYIKSAVM